MGKSVREQPHNLGHEGGGVLVGFRFEVTLRGGLRVGGRDTDLEGRHLREVLVHWRGGRRVERECDEHLLHTLRRPSFRNLVNREQT